MQVQSKGNVVACGRVEVVFFLQLTDPKYNVRTLYNVRIPLSVESLENTLQGQVETILRLVKVYLREVSL